MAAGTGVLTLAAAARGSHVLATDFAPAMVERLRERVAEAGLLDRVTAEVMDGQALEVPDASFDAVLSNFGVIFFPDPDRGFREMHRALRKNGRAVVSVWSAPDRIELLQVFMRAVNRVVPNFAPPGPPVWLRVQDPVVLKAALTGAGFSRVAIHTMTGAWPMPSVAWVKENIVGIAPAMQVLFAQFGDDRRHDILEAMGEALEARFGDGAFSLPAEGHLGVAHK